MSQNYFPLKSHPSPFLKKNLLLLGGALVNIFSCVSIPKGAKAVSPFEQEKYLGTWYEIARLDFRFERGLEQVTATYSLRPDHLIKVVNKGYDPAKRKWKTAVGKAKPVGSP